MALPVRRCRRQRNAERLPSCESVTLLTNVPMVTVPVQAQGYSVPKWAREIARVEQTRGLPGREGQETRQRLERGDAREVSDVALAEPVIRNRPGVRRRSTAVLIAVKNAGARCTSSRMACSGRPSRVSPHRTEVPVQAAEHLLYEGAVQRRDVTPVEED